MNKSLLAAIALTASFGALAQEATVFPEAPASTLTRAEVKAQAAAADRDVVFAGEATVFPDAAASSIASRAEVRAEAREALRKGVNFGGEATL
ncbi:MAG: DUF4148 domain-containing protein [Caldimonas sp.]|uniref:DUF4148 domain-containing protein n=1 Tax=Caldimonas sp. TaxID=2838790 RepID=UPI00391D9F10